MSDTIRAALDAAEWRDTDHLTCRDPDLDLDALERAHARVLTMYRACLAGGAASVADEWQALLVASGYGWPSRPKAILAAAVEAAAKEAGDG
jgi:hypothetical protein